MNTIKTATLGLHSRGCVYDTHAVQLIMGHDLLRYVGPTNSWDCRVIVREGQRTYEETAEHDHHPISL